MVYEETIDSWAEFEDKIAQYILSPAWSGKFAFRGQSNSGWPLRSSLLRLMTDEFPKLGLKSLERQATEHFAARAANYSFAPDRDHKDWLAWWPLMRHHGAPTRLLDWTRSPYVAAYFAVENLKADEDGAVYLVHIEEVNKATIEATGTTLPDSQFIEETWDDYKNPPHFIKFITPYPMTARMTAQQGMYSICKSPLMDHDEAISNMLPEKRRDEYFKRVIIPGRRKHGFAQHLQYMNITAGSLFPGTDGLGREIKEFIAHQIFTDSGLERVLAADPAQLHAILDATSRILESFSKTLPHTLELPDGTAIDLLQRDRSDQDADSQE